MKRKDMRQAMASVISIYCAGGIKKGPSDANKISWSDEDRARISFIMSPIDVVFLRPDEREDDISNAFTVFGRDHYQVSISDFVVVDARQRRGIGVGIEMLSAKYFRKPLICVAPIDSHYRRPELHYLGGTVRDYVHAHLFGLADAIVNDFDEAARWMLSFLDNPSKVKDITVLQAAIEQFKKEQLPRDVTMREALSALGLSEGE